MRIVAGQWKGRRITAPPGTLVRPTLDRVREAWMSILQLDLPGARVLDLYAGSGALGLEALSRGAASADFVENASRSLAALDANIEALGAGTLARVHRTQSASVREDALPPAPSMSPSADPLSFEEAKNWPRSGLTPASARFSVSSTRAGPRCRKGATPGATERRRSPSIEARSERVTIAIYAGSFDPLTRGHEDLIHRSCEFVDGLVVAIANNTSKKPLFTVEERMKLISSTVGDDKRIQVKQFEGLLVDFAKKVGASLNIRGLRAVSDFEYEFQMALMNRHMSEDGVHGPVG